MKWKQASRALVTSVLLVGPSIFASADKTSVVPVAGLIDINTASREQLRALPGVGRTYSMRIIRGRPYTSKGDLLEKKIVPTSIYAKIRTRIIARQRPLEKSKEER